MIIWWLLKQKWTGLIDLSIFFMLSTFYSIVIIRSNNFGGTSFNIKGIVFEIIVRLDKFQVTPEGTVPGDHPITIGKEKEKRRLNS
jgi:hypothetical protein